MILAFVILALYVVLIGSLFYGFQKMKPLSDFSIKPKTSFSIIVPFRNEAENLPKLLHTLSFLDYPNELFEVILVDDESDDNYTITNYEFCKALKVSILTTKQTFCIKKQSPKQYHLNPPIAPAQQASGFSNWFSYNQFTTLLCKKLSEPMSRLFHCS